MSRVCTASIIVGVLGLVLSALAYVLDPARFFRAYLTGYLFLLGIPIGCLALALVQFLTGGVWGLLLRRVFVAGASTLPLIFVLSAPIALGLSALYPWADQTLVLSDQALQQKSSYLNVPFFLLRAIGYYIVWAVLLVLLVRWTREQDRADDSSILPRLQRLSVVGLLLMGFTVSFAAIDWFMSLEPHWYSTAYPAIVATSAMLAALAFAIVVLIVLSTREPIDSVLTPQRLNDLGSLLLAFLMLWTYMAYFQYLIIWSGDLSDEIPWYLRRLEGGWRVVALGLALGGFALPFALLVFRKLKRNRWALLGIAALILTMRLLDSIWMVAPAFPNAVAGWQELAVVLGIGGIWLALFLNRLAATPLLPGNDQRMGEVLHADA